MFLRKLPKEVRARLKNGCDVLELGCGTGRWLAMMRREFPKSTFRGVDPDPETGAEVGFAETAGRTADADVVYLGEVLHLTDRAKTLANCARVLRPGGHLLVVAQVGRGPVRDAARPGPPGGALHEAERAPAAGGIRPAPVRDPRRRGRAGGSAPAALGYKTSAGRDRTP
jgi:SAM-dependent methyltransferase